MKENVKEADFVFVELLIQKLPKKLQENLERRNSSARWTMTSFSDALEKEIDLLKYADKHEVGNKQPKTNYPATAVSLGITTRPNRPLKCAFCFKEHRAETCMAFQTMIERIKRVEELGICENCFLNTHTNKDCSSKYSCRICRQRHHSLICNANQQSTSEKYVGSLSTSFDEHKCTALPTAIVTIKDSKTRTFFDQGSQESLITRSLVKTLDLQARGYRRLKLKGFGSNSSEVQLFDEVQIPFQVDDNTIEVKALVVNDDCLPSVIHMPGSSKLTNALIDKGLRVADGEIENDKAVNIQLLVGGDSYFKFVRNIVRVGNVTLLSSSFGVMLTGSVPADVDEIQKYDTSQSCFVLERQLNDLWSLDSIGISSEKNVSSDKKLQENFEKSISYNDKRSPVEN